MSVVVIVDAYSAGNLLAPEFKKRGFTCVHVQSTKEIYPIFRKSFVATDFVTTIGFDGNMSDLLKELSQFSITAVLPGTETGVHLADELSEQLGLKSNGIKISAARRNKYLMLETLRAAGIKVARQIKSANCHDLIAYKHKMSLKKVVVKPVESAGSEDVRICVNDTEIERAHNAIVGKVNILGLLNRESILQEYLDGNEYFINCVSLKGQHVVCDVWRHNKRPLNGFDFVYDRAELCDVFDPMEQEIIEYNKRALDALGIQFGPSHCEIIMTQNGPRMIEMGARLQGMSLPQLNDACLGFGPVDMTVDCYVDEARFHNKARAYRVKKFAMRVNLISERAGIFKGFSGLDNIESLPSFFYLRTISEPNKKIEKTVNYFTVPAFVVLVSEDRDRLFEDYQTIRMLEQQGQILTYE